MWGKTVFWGFAVVWWGYTCEIQVLLMQGPWARPFQETRARPGGDDCGPSQRNSHHAGWFQQGSGGAKGQNLCPANTVSNLYHFRLYYNYNTCHVFTPVTFGEQQTQISHRLEGTEEKLRNRESRPEDLHVIAELREMVSEREALVKKLVVSRAVSALPAATIFPAASSKPLCSRMTRSFTSWSWSTERRDSARSSTPVPMLVWSTLSSRWVVSKSRV